MIEKFVEYTNTYAETILQTPQIQEKTKKQNRSMSSKWRLEKHDKLQARN